MSVAAQSNQAVMAARPALLIVDDDPLIVDALCAALEDDFAPLGAADQNEVKSALVQLGAPPPFALVDLGLPPRPHRPDEGFAVVRELLARAPECAIVVVSGQEDAANAKRARALGAADFVAKPCSPKRLRDALLAAARQTKAAREALGLIGDSPPLTKLREQIAAFAPHPYPVLIEGESGSGKEVAAHALHRLSRPGKPFLALNCAAISPALVEPTLFGHARGAYTGAAAAAAGYFEDAADGTLFLDEIGEMPLEFQAKLLRVLESGEFQRLGETRPRLCAARLVAASNRRLRDEAERGNFRADLYHRISVLTLSAPPLREMGADRFALLAHCREKICAELNAAPFALDESAEALWRDYAFPGNVRELRNIVARLSVKRPGETIDAAALAAEMSVPDGAARTADGGGGVLESAADLREQFEQMEESFASAALSQHSGDDDAAAKALGVSPARLRAILRRRRG